MDYNYTERSVVALGKGTLCEAPHHTGEQKEVNDEDHAIPMDHEYEKMMREINVTNDSKEDTSTDEDEGMHSFDDQEDRQLCNKWLNKYGTYIPPTPKFLLIKNQGRTLFSEENVLRRTAWIGRLLNISDKSLLPEMRKIEYINENKEKIQAIAVKTETAEQATTLLKVTKIGSCKVSVEKDYKKNTISGVLFDPDNYLQKQKMTEEEMKQLLASEGVLSINKIGKETSRSYKVVFDKLEIPDRVKIFGERRSFPISNYIPNPLRCFKCQYYDHSKSKCRATTYTCQRCGGSHQNKIFSSSSPSEKKLEWECKETPQCIHCKQEHEAGDASCIRQKEQKEINKLMVNQKISRYEAKTRVIGNQAISHTRAIITAQKLEQKEVEAAQSKGVIDAIHKKLEQITSQLEKTMPEQITPQLEKTMPDKTPENLPGNLNEMILQAVETSTKKLQEDFEQKLKLVQTDLTKQTEAMNQLLQENTRLKAETKSLKRETSTLRSQLKAANDQLKSAKAHKIEPQKNQPQTKELKRKPNSNDNDDPRTKAVTSNNGTPRSPPKAIFAGMTVLQKSNRTSRTSTNHNQSQN